MALKHSQKKTIKYEAFILGSVLTFVFMGYAIGTSVGPAIHTDGGWGFGITLLLILFGGSFLFTRADPPSAIAVVISIILAGDHPDSILYSDRPWRVAGNSDSGDHFLRFVNRSSSSPVDVAPQVNYYNYQVKDLFR